MIKYKVCENLERTGLVKTAYTEKFEGHWRIFSLNPDGVDLVYYKDLAKDFGKEPKDMVRIPQKHTDNIRVVTKDVAGEGVVRYEIEGYYDGAITNEKGIILCTIEADCTPVYILDPVKKAIAMIHSGWRGAVKKIAIKAIEKMTECYGTEKNDVLVYLGPSICQKCYEVRIDVYDEFKKVFDENILKKVFCDKPDCDINDKKFLLDVAETVRLSLIEYGVKEENIERARYCTYHDNLFDSWRRDGKTTGHILSTIMLL